ncbi:33_t:CDS:10 [Entrophospora sp. SA101]|nr:33_t:CDS:10 [Entrophospora sp. SA101]
MKNIYLPKLFFQNALNYNNNNFIAMRRKSLIIVLSSICCKQKFQIYTPNKFITTTTTVTTSKTTESTTDNSDYNNVYDNDKDYNNIITKKSSARNNSTASPNEDLANIIKELSKGKPFHEKVHFDFVINEIIKHPETVILGDYMYKEMGKRTEFSHGVGAVDSKENTSRFINALRRMGEIGQKYQDKGYKSFEDIIINEKLSPSHKFLMKHAYDFDRLFPKEEMDLFKEIIISELKSMDSGYIAEPCAEYRRNARNLENSRQFEMVISHVEFDTTRNHIENKNLIGSQIIKELIERLKNKQICVDFIKIPSILNLNYLAACLPGTNNNRKILLRLRDKASEKGFYLCSNKFFAIESKDNDGKLQGGQGLIQKSILVNSEQEIFDILGIKYVEPHEPSIAIPIPQNKSVSSFKSWWSHSNSSSVNNKQSSIGMSRTISREYNNNHHIHNNNSSRKNLGLNKNSTVVLGRDHKDQNSKVANELTNSKDPSTKQDKIVNSDQENQNYNNDLIENKRWSLFVQTLPENSQSWLHFFTRMSLIENNPSSSQPRIGTTDKRRLIENAQLQLVQAQTQIANSTTAVTGTTNSAITTILKPVPNNMVLPIFDDIARHKIRSCPTSMFQQTLHTINSYFFPLEKNNADGPFSKFFDEMTRSTIDVKRVAIIGVHGWFPAKLVRALVGEPTGTSQKFCDMMGKALLGYLSQHGIVLPEKAITCIPLEGEGTIEKREEILHQNLLNNKTWVEALSLADVIFVTTHSQGTPVSTILLAKLINERRINPKRQRVCMLAMAGISHGPFPYLKESYIMKYIVGAGRGPESDAARELFEFMHPDSGVAIKYRNSLKLITNDGVKIVYVGSMDDQVVPLYSSLFTGVNHPSIIRAMYIHGPLYQANDFLANLLVFAVSLRNANINDHGLMVYLSEVVAGSLYSEGHSALYDEINVYTLAVKYLFETVKHPPKNVKLDLFRAQKQYNPFYLPWAMRGILEDKDVVRSESFSRDLHKLRKLFEEWEPTSKVMRDVKFRLEPLREFISRAKL